MDKFNKLSRDTRPQEQPQGTYPFAKNGIQDYIKRSVFNEPGFLLSDASIPYTPMGVLETDKYPIIFSTNNTNSAIGYYDFDNDIYTPILDDISLGFKFNFSTNRPITGQAQRNYKNEVVGAFTDKFLKPFYLNFDNPQVTVLDDMLLFVKAIPPDINTTVVSGGTLLPGAYYVSVKYLKNDGTESSYLTVSSPVVVTGTTGTVSDKALQIQINNIDPSWNKVQIAIISKINGVISAVQLSNTISVSSSTTYTYNGAELTETITLDEIFVVMRPYATVGTIGQLNDALYIADLTSRPRYEMQRYANLARIKWTSKLVTTDDNPANLMHTGEEKTFMHEEVYAFYIRYKIVDGTSTDAFFLTGPDLTSGDRATSTVASGKGITAKKYQVEDTIPLFDAVNKNGYFGKWENENEVYPSTADFDSSAVGGQDLRGQKVRHHRFPSIAWCKDNLYQGTTNYGKDTLDMLGISVENVIIPSQYAADIVGWEIFYAKRNLSNSTVVGQSALLFGAMSNRGGPTRYSTGGNWNGKVEFRTFDHSAAMLTTTLFHFHSFDMLFNNPSVSPQYLSLQLKMQQTDLRNTAGLIYSRPSADDTDAGSVEVLIDYLAKGIPPSTTAYKFQAIDQANANKAGWVPNNILLGTWDNRFIERMFAGVIVSPDSGLQPSIAGNSLLLKRNSRWDITMPDEITYLTNLMNLRSDLFVPFAGQSLVRAASSNSIINTTAFYHGDTYICEYTFHTYGSFSATGPGPNLEANRDNGVRVARRIICETASNLYSRFEDVAKPYSKYYPKTPLTVADRNNYLAIFTRDYDPNDFGYTKDSNALDDLIIANIYNTFSEDLINHPYRIHRSGKLSRQTKFRSWRSFLPLDYYEAQKNMGRIIHLEGMDDRLLIHHENALFLTQDKTKLESDIIAITLGSGDIFQFQPQEAMSAKLGYAGTQHELACVRTPAGYVFIDSKQGQIFIYKGQLELVNNMLNTFFKEYLRLKETNVFIGNGYTIGYDSKYKRILLTVKNETLPSQTVLPYPEDLSTLTIGDIVYKDGRYIRFLGANTSPDYECPILPEPAAEDFEFTIAEDVPVGTVVGTVTGTDVDNFFIVGGSIPFSLNPTAGVITVVGPLDFYIEDEYVFNAIASNDNGSDSFTITINLTEVNRAPIVYNQTVTIPDTTVTDAEIHTMIATDREGDTLTFSITAGNLGTTFAINSATGVVTVVDGSLLNGIDNPVYILTISVSDGVLTSTAMLIINVTHVNIQPTADDQLFTILDNFKTSNTDLIIGTVIEAIDPDNDEDDAMDYSIVAEYPTTSNLELDTDSTSATFMQLKLKSAVTLDPLTAPYYSIIIRATDKGVPVLYKDFEVRVDVLYNTATLENIPYTSMCTEEVIIEDFDFLAVRYGWLTGAGTDLDTGTGFTGFTTGNAEIDGIFLGYGFNSGSYVMPTSTTPKVMQHGGDNTSTGGEMVLIDFFNLETLYPSIPTSLTADLLGLWYASIGAGAGDVLPGQVTFELIAWKGGAMVKGTNSSPTTLYDPLAIAADTSTFDWSNPTADLLVFQQTFTKQILFMRTGATNSSGGPVTDGTSGVAATYGPVGQVTFNRTTKNATLTF